MATVGEMIASHHRQRDARWHARYAEDMAFHRTPIGGALHRFEQAIVRVCQLEAQEWPSDKALKAASDRVEQARDEIRTLLFFQLGEDRRDVARRRYLNPQLRNISGHADVYAVES